MDVFEVNNVEEAVKLATEFQRSGRFDWFRGQTNDWPLHPSLARLREGSFELKAAERRLKRFYTWVRQTPDLKGLIKDVDAFLAVAQHYGIPTMFLDFTTDPGIAGYFAADRQKNPKVRGCIYCINSKDVQEHWLVIRKIIKRKFPNLDFIKVKLPNLWRLEAQHGVFLYCFGNWERWNSSAIARIYFPHTSRPSFPTKNHVYPDRKSQLELLLDQFFMADSFTGSKEILKEFYPQVKVFKIKSPDEGYFKKYFVDGELPVMRGWQPRTLRKWRTDTQDALRAIRHEQRELDVDLNATPAVLSERVTYGILRAIHDDPKLRKKVVRWMGRRGRSLPASLNRAVDWLWNGLRLLPYGDEEVAEGVGTCFALHRVGFGKRNSESDQDRRLAGACIHELVCIEMGSWEGSYSRSFVSKPLLVAAVRRDIREKLRPKYKEYANEPNYLLGTCFTPNHLFDFRKLARLFAVQIAPAQVMNPDARVAYFSPASIKNFGLP